MILVDTSVWIDHLRKCEPQLAMLLEEGRVLTHPFVIGEIGLGNLRQRAVILEAFDNLPMITEATHAEVMHLIEKAELAGTGIGFVDAHLLASALLHGAVLWTRDQRLRAAAIRLGVSFDEPTPT